MYEKVYYPRFFWFYSELDTEEAEIEFEDGDELEDAISQ